MKNGMIKIGMFEAYLERMLIRGLKVAYISYFTRTLQEAKAIGSTMCTSESSTIWLNKNGPEERYNVFGTYKAYYVPIMRGKERFYHGVILNAAIGNDLFVSKEETAGEELYEILMKKYPLPLLKWWGKPILSYALQEGLINAYSNRLHTECIETEYSLQGTDDLREMQIYDLTTFDYEALKSAIQVLFQQKQIWISKKEQKAINFNSMDEYFRQYGTTLVENLEKLLDPESELKGEVDAFTLNSIRLYPQQAAMVNGVTTHLLNGAPFSIICEGMGTGKTAQAAAICESYFVQKETRRSHKALKDIYMDESLVKYRNLVMCPGHLLEKWKGEIERQIPYAKATIVTDFSQLLELRKSGSQRVGKEFYILSKDFAKLSYSLKPVPKKEIAKMAYMKKCTNPDCGLDNMPVRKCVSCGGKDFEKSTTKIETIYGMKCPYCGEVLAAYTASGGICGLTANDFAYKTGRNSNCIWCGESLWMPHVKNIGAKKISPWYRATCYRNKAQKGKTTVWVHKEYARKYYAENETEPISVSERDGVRKYSPASFIKKYMKGYFDIAVFDECHVCKDGDSAQGNAMHCLIKATKKQLALTGTIAGGKAEDLYYLIYRLAPWKMTSKGYRWTDVANFSKQYGKVEQRYEYAGSSSDENLAEKVSARGRSLSSPKTKPGISPTIFTDFLLDCAVFLDLSDMSSYLPDLKEMVVTVPMARDVARDHSILVSRLTSYAKRRESGGFALLSQALQYGLFYPDMPYGNEEIRNPVDGDILIRAAQHDEYRSGEKLLPKEEKLIELIKSELSEGRKSVVFAECSGKNEWNVTHRLRDILEAAGIFAVVVEAESPGALKRENWIREQAKDGVEVFITNPKLIETGVDLCWTEGGKKYNYPTLIFYQLGYSLFTVWQASRRHYRMNQTMECRTYYMAYEGTAQAKVIELIAEKQVATAAIQGKFSVEGISAMAEGVDARVALASSLADQDVKSGSALQKMFDVLHSSDKQAESYVTMQVYEELLGKEEVERRKKAKEDEMFENLFGQWDEDFMDLQEPGNEEPAVVVAQKQPKAGMANIFSLFDF